MPAPDSLTNLNMCINTNKNAPRRSNKNIPLKASSVRATRRHNAQCGATTTLEKYIWDNRMLLMLLLSPLPESCRACGLVCGGITESIHSVFYSAVCTTHLRFFIFIYIHTTPILLLRHFISFEWSPSVAQNVIFGISVGEIQITLPKIDSSFAFQLFCVAVNFIRFTVKKPRAR